MASVVFVIQLMFLSLTVFGIENSSSTQSGFHLLYCPGTLSSTSEAPCLVRGKTTTRQDDYTHTLGVGSHMVQSGLATWNTARRICEEQGSHLVILNSVAEAKAVGQLLTKSGGSYAWTGVHDLYEEDEFVTIHDQPLALTGYDRWARGQPDNGNGNENCVIVHPDGEISDVPCEHHHSIICEIP